MLKKRGWNAVAFLASYTQNLDGLDIQRFVYCTQHHPERGLK